MLQKDVRICFLEIREIQKLKYESKEEEKHADVK